jgi:Sec-independent protein translocase protein TatA
VDGAPSCVAQARAREARRTAAVVCGPKPVPEAVGDAISAVGELVRALRSTKKRRKKPAKGSRSARSRAASRAASGGKTSRSGKTPARRGVVVVEARVEPRAAARSRTRARRSARMTLDAPIVVAPAGSPTAPQAGEG